MSLVQRSISRASRSRNACRFRANAGRSSGERRESPSTMFCVMMGASPGSSEKWGLPSGCTSPIERSTRVEGTSSRGMPREISIRPAAPRTMFGLFAPRTATSAHISSSAPFSISASARLSFSIMLGRTSASWKFCVPRVSTSTPTGSPPTASTSDLRSGMVATTRNFFAAWTPGASRASVIKIAPTTRLGRRMVKPPSALERMRGVGAENERALEEHFVHLLRAPAVRVGALAVGPIGVLVREAEAEELRRPERDVGLDGSLLPWVRGELRPVVPHARSPAAEGLHLAADVPAEAVTLALLDEIDETVAVRVYTHEHATQRIDRFSSHRHERVEPAVGPILVPTFPAEEGIALLFRRLAAGDRHAELHRARVAELEERPEPTGEERDPERAPAEGGLVVAVEDAYEPLEVEGQVGDDRRLEPLLLEATVAEEVAQDVRPIDPRQVVLVDDVGVAEAVPYLAELGLGAVRQSEHGNARLGEIHFGIRAARILTRLDPDLGVCVGVDLTEHAQLDLAREEAILLAGERAALGLLDVRLHDVADEVAGDTDVEEELAGAPLLVERERLARAREVDCRDSSRRRRGGLGHRSGRGRPRFPNPGTITERLQLLLELLHLPAQRFRLLRDGRRSEERRVGKEGRSRWSPYH